jgi:DNA-binding NtrC family response regulator
VILVVASSREETLAALGRLRRESPRSRLLGLFCGPSTPELEYFSPGLDDYLSCPWTPGDLHLRLRRLLGPAAPPLETASGWQRHASLVGNSQGFLKLLDQVPKVARSQATVLLTGETGTGKELVARAVHYLSARTGRPFVPLNCGAVPDHLFENELFGHAKGAFTDAGAAERGLLAEAEGGTFFFDEIDSLSPAAQVKILRLLEDRQYRPLGAPRSIVADVRIIAATNAELTSLVGARSFREDLYHRLSVVTLRVPPLRERAEDIPLLARHFLRKYAHESSHPDCEFDGHAIESMLQYRWPGNVRELESVIHRALILSSSPKIRADDLEIGDARPEERSGLDEPFQQAKARAIRHFEFGYLTELLTRYGGNISQAARAAGKDRRALQRLLERHGLNRLAYRRTA